MLKKVLTLSLSVLLVFGLLPSAMLTVSAATYTCYLDKGGVAVSSTGAITGKDSAGNSVTGTLTASDTLVITQTTPGSATTNTISINTATPTASLTCTVKLSGVNMSGTSGPFVINSSLSFSTTLNLKLSGTNTIASSTSSGYKAGITVTEWATLNISSDSGNDSTDTLAVKSGRTSAAIGGSASPTNNCGTINISGGTITAGLDTTSNDAAAIGGYYGSGSATVKSGTINISGGIVNATSNRGAAIGSGATNNVSSTFPAIVNISGGTVTANSTNATAIGAGTDVNSSTTSNSATVTITGGNITAQGARQLGKGTANGTGTVYIKNASVLCKNTSGTAVAFSGALNQSGGSAVYLTTVTVPTASASTALNVNSSSFTVKSDASSKVYLYLPASSCSGSTATIGGTTYTQTAAVTPATDGTSTMTITNISSVSIDISTGNIVVATNGAISGAVSGTLASGATITVTQSNPSTSTTNYISITSFNCTVKLNGVNMVLTTASPVQILGTSSVNVQLQGTNTLTGGTSTNQFAALNVASGAAVTISSYNGIDGDGSLTAKGGRGSAAIGANRAANCGTITINSGTINASIESNDLSSAAIGGAYGAATALTCGTITINGGIITATGQGAGPGIGSGITSGCTSSTNVTINITGGAITATGGATNGGSAIGAGGGDYDTQPHNATVTITGGTIKATVSTVQATPIGKGTTNGTGTVYIKDAYVSTNRPLTGVLTQSSGTLANLTTIALPTATGSNNNLKAFELTFDGGTKLPINMNSDSSSNIYIYLPSAKTSCSAKNTTTNNTYTVDLNGSNNVQVSRISTGTFGNGNTITAYVGLTNNTVSSYDAVVYIAYYDSSNELISLATPATSTLTANGGTGALNPSIALPSSGTTGGKVQVFIWNNSGNIMPLISAKTIQ